MSGVGQRRRLALGKNLLVQKENKAAVKGLWWESEFLQKNSSDELLRKSLSKGRPSGTGPSQRGVPLRGIFEEKEEWKRGANGALQRGRRREKGPNSLFERGTG